MKTIIIFLSLLFYIAGIKIEAQSYGLDNTDPAVFTKFRIPKTDLRSLWFNTSLNFYSRKVINSGDPNYYSPNNSYYSTFQYDLRPHYLLLHESEDMYFNIEADMEGYYNHYYSSNETTRGTAASDKSKQNNYSALFDLNSTLNNYINSGDLFYSIGSAIHVDMNQSKTDIISGMSTGNYSNNKSQNYSISIGIGSGKLRNVTPIVTAVRFQERMKQLGLISNNLSDNAIEDLAMQFYKQSYYADIYSRPEKYFWHDIENVLSKDGTSFQGLNMYADAYLREAVNEVRFFRQEGFLAGLNLQFQYFNVYNYPAIMTENLYLYFNPYLKYSHQLNLNSQINISLSLSGGPNLIKNYDVKQRYAIVTNLGYNYELTDRLVCSIDNNLEYDLENHNSQYKYLLDILNFNLSYFIEDNLMLNAAYQWFYNYSKNPEIRYENLNNNLNIGFTYYIGRGFLIN